LAGEISGQQQALSSITPQILLQAYAAGVFPMAETAEDTGLYWVDPDERGLIPLDDFHVPRSLRKAVRQKPFEIRIDTSFAAVIAACAERTNGRKVTWINARIRKLYGELAQMGAAHCIECWLDDRLVGGLYGVRIGAAFFGESMFSRQTNASKIALVHLVARLNAGGFKLLDAQFMNPHLQQFGAVPMLKADYHVHLAVAVQAKANFHNFKGDNDPDTVLRLAMAKP
jgi:leucyl/phenylalanyl-tRNA---protein transferase